MQWADIECPAGAQREAYRCRLDLEGEEDLDVWVEQLNVESGLLEFDLALREIALPACAAGRASRLKSAAGARPAPGEARQARAGHMQGDWCGGPWAADRARARQPS